MASLRRKQESCVGRAFIAPSNRRRVVVGGGILHHERPELPRSLF